MRWNPPDPQPPAPPHEYQDHTVQTGETLSSIAQHYGVDLHRLIAINPQVHDPDKIYTGQVVHVHDITQEH
jgi:LysM repeat protein